MILLIDLFYLFCLLEKKGSRLLHSSRIPLYSELWFEKFAFRVFCLFSFRLFLVFNHIFRTSAKPIHCIPGAAINIIVLYKSLLLLGLRERKQVHFLLSAFQSVSQSSVTGSGLESTLISLRETTSGDLPSREINSAKGLQRFSRTCSHSKSHTNSHFTKY